MTAQVMESERVSQKMTKTDHWLEAERILRWIEDHESTVDGERHCLGTEALVHAVLASSPLRLA